jgi:hypothetical protein
LSFDNSFVITTVFYNFVSNSIKVMQINLSLNLSEKKYQQLLAFLTDNLISFKETNDDSIPIPEWQKELVRTRLKNAKDSDYISWDEALQELNK